MTTTTERFVPMTPTRIRPQLQERVDRFMTDTDPERLIPEQMAREAIKELVLLASGEHDIRRGTPEFVTALEDAERQANIAITGLLALSGPKGV